MNSNYYYSGWLSFLLLLLIQPISAQSSVSIRLADTTVAASVTEICIPIIADSFPDIAAMQFSLVWDASIIGYDRLEYGDNPLGITENTSFTPTDSTFGISWISSGQSGITLSPGTPIFSICFTPQVTDGASTISFDSYLPGEFIQAETVMLFPFTLNDGSVTITDQALESVLPGDTNRDSLVNADDLLNIGLGFGLTGPGRPNPQTTFTAQSAPVWDVATPLSGTNYCHVNADGNTQINAIDQAVMEQNYGESALLWSPPIVNQGNSMPIIFLASDPLVGGELSSVDVFIGSEDQPVPVGYGLSFGIQMSETEIDLNSVSVNFTDNFLGEDLLTFAEFYPNELGLLEIALSRKDQMNSSLAGGKVCTITFRTIAAATDYDASFLVTPYRYINNEEVAITLAQAISQITVLAEPNSTNEPAWASALVLAPNPVRQDESLMLSGFTNQAQSMAIYSSNGQLVRQLNTAAQTIEIDGIPQGTYFLQISKGKETIMRKFVVID